MALGRNSSRLNHGNAEFSPGTGAVIDRHLKSSVIGAYCLIVLHSYSGQEPFKSWLSSEMDASNDGPF
jgi:hypothetical protein